MAADGGVPESRFIGRVGEASETRSAGDEYDRFGRDWDGGGSSINGLVVHVFIRVGFEPSDERDGWRSSRNDRRRSVPGRGLLAPPSASNWRER
jgi:hypothetical protein